MNKRLFVRQSLRSFFKVIAYMTVICGILVSVWQTMQTQSSFLDNVFPENNSVSAGDWTPPTAPLFWVEEDTVEVKLDWLTPPEPDLDTFSIYRSTDDVTYSLLSSGLSAATTTFTDATTSTETDYFYKVTATDTSGNENDVLAIAGKTGFTKNVVIDDDGLDADFNSTGTITASADWTAFTTSNRTGTELDAISRAVGGDSYDLDSGFVDPSFSWLGSSSLLGQYEVFVSYVCDSGRGTAFYDIFSGATLLDSSVPIDQSLQSSDGTTCGNEEDIASRAEWRTVGTYDFQDTPEVEIASVSGRTIRADAVAFTRIGVVQPVHVTPASGSAVNPASLILDWSDILDDEGGVTYEYQISTDNTFGAIDFSGTGLVTSELDTTGLGLSNNTTYSWRVRACNALAACSAYTDPWSFFTDTTAPLSVITVTNSPTRDVENRVSNGGFESDLTGWKAIGDVAIVSGPENGATPFESKMVRIGRTTDPGESVDVNILSQEIDHTVDGNGVHSLGFYYNFMTYEDGTGFDTPGFMVFVGDEMVHQVWADSVDTDGSSATLDSTGWRFLSIDVADRDDATLSIAFYGGNTADLNKQSFLYLDNVSTNEIVVNSAAQFEITAQDDAPGEVDTVYYEYEVSSVTQSGSGASPLQFTLTGQPDAGLVEYWSEDTVGNVEAKNSFHVFIDAVKPDPVTDLTAFDDSDGDFTLTWTAVSDTNPFGVDQAAEYDIRYSTASISAGISDVDWEALPEPIIRNIDGLPGGGARAPLESGEPEIYSVHVNDGAATYYFAVRVKDHANNISDVVAGSIATTGVVTPSTSPTIAGDVVINEIMWMGSTVSTADEWLELRNLTDAPISLENWVIEELGDAGTPNITLPAGSEIPANGYFVIANYAESDASSALKNAPDYVTSSVSLLNTGEQLTLKDDTGTAIDQTPTGVWAAGTTGLEERSMERNNDPGTGTPLDGTDSTNWHSCVSASCADARDSYWDTVTDNYGTPGGANLSLDASQIEQILQVEWLSADTLKLNLTAPLDAISFDYVITYSHKTAGVEQSEGAQGHFEFSSAEHSLEIGPIYLGTCSGLDISCISHAPVTEVVLTGDLVFPDGSKKQFEKKLQAPVEPSAVEGEAQ